MEHSKNRSSYPGWRNTSPKLENDNPPSPSHLLFPRAWLDRERKTIETRLGQFSYSSIFAFQKP